MDETTAVCLFVSDVNRNDRDFTVTVDKYRELLDQAAIKPQIDVFAIFQYFTMNSTYAENNFPGRNNLYQFPVMY